MAANSRASLGYVLQLRAGEDLSVLKKLQPKHALIRLFRNHVDPGYEFCLRSGAALPGNLHRRKCHSEAIACREPALRLILEEPEKDGQSYCELLGSVTKLLGVAQITHLPTYPITQWCMSHITHPATHIPIMNTPKQYAP
jgi:hypothetical protein